MNEYQFVSRTRDDLISSYRGGFINSFPAKIKETRDKHRALPGTFH
jgi:hypothetical protein